MLMDFTILYICFDTLFRTTLCFIKREYSLKKKHNNIIIIILIVIFIIIIVIIDDNNNCNNL